MISNHKDDLKPLDDGQDQKKQFDKIRRTMEKLYEIAKQQYQAGGGQGELVISLVNVEATFDAAYPVLINELYKPQALLHMNPNTMCSTTLGKNLSKRNAALKKAAAAEAAAEENVEAGEEEEV